MKYLVVSNECMSVMSFSTSLEVYDFLCEYLYEAETAQIGFDGGKIDFEQKKLVQKVFRLKNVVTIGDSITVINIIHND